MTKIVRLAIPAYDGKVHCETAKALIGEIIECARIGIRVEAGFLPGCSLITSARDILADDFIKSNCDKIVFVDSDVSWEPGAIAQLVSHDVDFVGGAYRLKQDKEGYPTCFLQGVTQSDPETGLVSVHMVPGGFLCLSRKVFAKMRNANEKLYTPPGLGREINAYWSIPPGGGEDGNFCDAWRDLGGTVWLDPELTLTHTGGSKNFTGHFGNYIRAKLAQDAA